MLAPGAAAQRGLMLAEAITQVRDLVNTPAEHLGPEQLAAAAQALARNTTLGPREIAERSMVIASEICIYTNSHLTVEEL